MYRVDFYKASNRSSPVIKFLNSCQPSLKTKILRQLKYVQEFGLSPAIPNIKKLTGTPLWELRILGKDNVRIICGQSASKRVVVLHVFRKKKRKTPTREMNISLKRYKVTLD